MPKGCGKGRNAGDRNDRQLTKFEPVINLKTHKAVGLDIRASMLACADEVIELPLNLRTHQSGLLTTYGAVTLLMLQHA